jgi:hypothetical protein
MLLVPIHDFVPNRAQKVADGLVVFVIMPRPSPHPRNVGFPKAKGNN